jgi:hypothetical protein
MTTRADRDLIGERIGTMQMTATKKRKLLWLVFDGIHPSEDLGIFPDHHHALEGLPSDLLKALAMACDELASRRDAEDAHQIFVPTAAQKAWRNQL